MSKHRKSLDKLYNLLSKERIIILLGSRQVGKTTLMRMLQEKLKNERELHFFSMESPTDLEIFNEGVQGLKQRNILKENKKICLLIDEFHYLQDPNRLFKEIYDLFPEVTIVASGSSNVEIQQKIKESLAGRKLTFNIYPLDFYEYIQFLDPGEEIFFDNVDIGGESLESKKTILIHFEETFKNFVLYGGLPKVVLEKEEEAKKIYLEEVFTSYIQKDIKGILKNIDIVPFNQLIQIIASQVGNLLNVSELSNTLRLSRNEITHHLEVLKGTFVNFLLKPYATNKRKEVVKTPKTFFYDNGIRNQILKQFAPLALRHDSGALLENAIFMEIKKNIPVSQEIYYWRTKNKTEVDFIIRRDENLFPIEVKKGAEKTVLPNLESFATSHSVHSAFILNATEWFVQKKGKITFYFIPHFLAGKIPNWISSL